MLNGRYGRLIRLSVHYWYGCPHRYTRLFLESAEVSRRKRTFLVNMADTRETEYTLAPATKGNSDLWKHFNPHERKIDGQTYVDVAVCKQCNSVAKLAGGTSNM